MFLGNLKDGGTPIFGVFNSINKGSRGSKNPEIIEFEGFGHSHHKTEFVLDQIEAE